LKYARKRTSLNANETSFVSILTGSAASGLCPYES